MSPERDKTETTDLACAVCERRLLPGERPLAFVTTAAVEVTVCELCKPRAEAAGWLRPDQAAAVTAPEGARRRRQRGSLLGGLRARTERPATPERHPASSRNERPATTGQDEPGMSAEPAFEGSDPAPPRAERQTTGSHASLGPRSAAGPDVAEAIAAFNASEYRRTVSGLSRSLGAPQATAIAIRTAAGANGARLTIVWDLAWYQWEIGPGKRRPEIRQIAKGESPDQLRAADRNWNVDVGEDGTLKRRSGAGA